MDEKIREIIGTHAGLSVPADSLADDADLYAAGMTSFASVNVMIALEDDFEIEFPEHLLTRAAFESIASIRSAVTEIKGSAAV